MAMEGQQMHVDLDSTQEIICDECGHNVFKPAFFLRKISRFVSPDGQDRLLPLDTMECSKCGNKSYSFDNFMDLSLSLPRSKVKITGYVKLEECL